MSSCKHLPSPDELSSAEFEQGFSVGHPEGDELSVGFGRNRILDHDLHRDLGSVCWISYRAATERGSSSEPVFDENADVVAVHRRCTTDY